MSDYIEIWSGFDLDLKVHDVFLSILFGAYQVTRWV
jgi:hypothetical protein